MIKLSNVLMVSNIDNTIEFVKTTGGEGWDTLKTIAKFLYYLMHPSLIFKGLWEYTVIYSFWVCMFIALISVILYSFGFKKYARYAPFSIAIYTLIKMIASAF